MALEVRIPDEIKDYKESIIAGLSIRQLLCGAVALACGIPTFLLLKDINEDLATYATMLIVVPAFCVGFIKRDGYNFEIWLQIKLKSMFGKKQREYMTFPEDNFFPDEIERYRQFVEENEEEDTNTVTEKKGKNKTKEVREVDKKSKANRNRNRNEYELIEVTKESIKRKRKAAYKSIKAATRSYRKKKQKKEKAA